MVKTLELTETTEELVQENIVSNITDDDYIVNSSGNVEFAQAGNEDIAFSYLKSLSKIPLLTPQEELELARRAQKGDSEAKKLLAKHNLRLVVSVAKKYSKKQLPFIDLVQEGNVGLLRAIEKFDYTKGFRFSTYAIWWIRQAITRALSDKSRMIRLPVHLVEQINQVEKTKEKLGSDLGREATKEELSLLTDVPLEQLNKIDGLKFPVISLDFQLSDEDSENSLVDTIEAPDSIKPENQLFSSLVKDTMDDAVEKFLSEKEKEVLKRHFGLDGFSKRTLRIVAEELGIAYEEARRVQASALKKLRHPNAAHLLKPLFEAIHE